ncbi:MAG: sigma-54 dependent transcriptional regulator [Desulfobaccales bacterium]|jgi:two-component system NtrC family response regulator
MARVLIIDDDQMFGEMLSEMVQTLGQESLCAPTLAEGLRLATAGGFDVVFLDVRMPDGSGLEMLPQVRQTSSAPEVIIITGAGDPDGAELAILNGAWDYIEKPSSIKQMSLPLVRALQYRQEKRLKKPPVALNLEGIVGQSPQMRACYDLVAQAADSDANVLIYGETGTGKELFAQAIHRNSHRSGKGFVVVDCAALPSSLVESALFGHEKGAFTSADRSQVGLIKQADGGTLFLDEVGELPIEIQKAFLRVLQERRFRPVGSRFETESDFRLVAATNRDLDELAAKGLFRRDLLFRLRAITLDLPPLRHRYGDLKDLTLFHTARICEKWGIGPKGFAPEFLEALLAHDWPGNVRELFNTLDRALAESRYEPTLFPKHLTSQIRIKVARAAVAKESSADAAGGNGTGERAAAKTLPRLHDFRQTTIEELENLVERLMILTEAPEIDVADLPEKIQGAVLSHPNGLEEFPAGGADLAAAVAALERRLILRALDRSNWVKSQAARLLHLNRTTLLEKMKKQNIPAADCRAH